MFHYHSAYTVHRIHNKSSTSTESKYPMSRIINLSKCIELKLHEQAASFEDYLDMTTLPQRIELIKSRFRRDRTIKSNKIIHKLSDTFDRQCDFKNAIVNES